MGIPTMACPEGENGRPPGSGAVLAALWGRHQHGDLVRWPIGYRHAAYDAMKRAT